MGRNDSSTSTDDDDVKQILISKEEEISKKKKKKKKVKKDKKEKKETKKKKRKYEETTILVKSEEDDETKDEKKKLKKLKKRKKEKSSKKDKKEKKQSDDNNNKDDREEEKKDEIVSGRLVVNSANENENNNNNTSKDDTTTTKKKDVTLLLFYQYVEPPWDDTQLDGALKFVRKKGEEYGLTGRMRVAKEGLNCTLTGSYEGIRRWCAALRSFETDGRCCFADTEFKLTDDLPQGQLFPKLHAFLVEEIVNYGLNGEKAPSISTYSGIHLEPKEYHKKMVEENTVIIDVRNHYEAAIGAFVPPDNGAKYIDPMMRKSTEFPVWLDKPETKELLRDKQVLMYCTGGVRCERASALLRQKMDTEEDTRALNIKGVYQLQGGIDKYFRNFPEGGWWKGKNYTFDKRFAHAPPILEANERRHQKINNTNESTTTEQQQPPSSQPKPDDPQLPQKMGKCEACSKPWDMYRGKRRCPTCGVPSLICRDCYDKIDKHDKNIRCDLCVAQGITHKSQIRKKEEEEFKAYKQKHNLQQPSSSSSQNHPSGKNNNKNYKPVPNPEKITRLYIQNMNKDSMDEATLCETLTGITHIQWLYGGRNKFQSNKEWLGTANVEMATADDAALAVGMSGMKVLNRPMYISFAKPDPKDVWPPPNTRVI